MAIQPAQPILMTPEEVKASNCRLDALLFEQYGDQPLTVNNDPIGSFRYQNKQVIFSFRGSIGRPMEILNIGLSSLRALQEKAVSGKVHGNIYAKFLTLKSQIDSKLNSVNMEEADFLIEGYSQGSMLASLTAAYLIEKVAPSKIKVVTFATLPLFDEEALLSYNSRLKERHLSFIAEQDGVVRKPVINLSIYAPGQTLLFSAELDETYLKRIQSTDWTMLTKVASWAVQLKYTKAEWEAHMPPTYHASQIALAIGSMSGKEKTIM